MIKYKKTKQSRGRGSSFGSRSKGYLVATTTLWLDQTTSIAHFGTYLDDNATKRGTIGGDIEENLGLGHGFSG